MACSFTLRKAGRVRRCSAQAREHIETRETESKRKEPTAPNSESLPNPPPSSPRTVPCACSSSSHTRRLASASASAPLASKRPRASPLPSLHISPLLSSPPIVAVHRLPPIPCAPVATTRPAADANGVRWRSARTQGPRWGIAAEVAGGRWVGRASWRRRHERRGVRREEREWSFGSRGFRFSLSFSLSFRRRECEVHRWPFGEAVEITVSDFQDLKIGHFQQEHRRRK